MITGDDIPIVFVQPEHTAHSGTLAPIHSSINGLPPHYNTELNTFSLRGVQPV